MTNELILLKLQQRIQKLGSDDYGNLETWMYLEAFNKAQIEWIRRQLEGINQTKTGAESTTRRIDDLQFILITKDLTLTDKGIYWTSTFPDDYLQFNRVSCMAQDVCCPPRPMQVFESVEVDRDINLADIGKQPNFYWATTFCTVSGGNINIYTNDLFDITDATLTYYRTPVNIEVTGVANPYTGAVSTADVLCEAADNIIELFIEDAAKILTLDIENYQKTQFLAQNANMNT